MPRADWNVLRSFPIPIPPAEFARRFSEVTRGSLDVAQRLMLASRQLGELRDLLLPKLVTGQIDVSKLDLDGVLEAAG